MNSDVQPFRYAVSLGDRCDVKWQLTLAAASQFGVPRSNNLLGSYCFDWLITPHSALVKALEADFAEWMILENIVFRKYKQNAVPIDSIYNVEHPHAFTKTGETLSLSDVRSGYQKYYQKTSYLMSKFLETLDNDGRKLFVLHGERNNDEIDEVVSILKSKTNNFHLRYIGFSQSDSNSGLEDRNSELLSTRTVRPSAYPGDIDTWQAALSDVRFLRDS